jgi:hypothetical protein
MGGRILRRNHEDKVQKEKKISAKTLHVLPHIRLTLTALRWKRN